MPLDNAQGVDFKGACDMFRTQIKDLCVGVSTFKNNVGTMSEAPGQNKGEIMANLTLAFRHLEDAAMRVGKAIQASEGGKSPLGGPSTPQSDMPKTATGQVWKQNDGENRVCVVVVNELKGLVWMDGVVDMVDPCWSIEFLHRNYQPEDGWRLTTI